MAQLKIPTPPGGGMVRVLIYLAILGVALVLGLNYFKGRSGGWIFEYS